MLILIFIVVHHIFPKCIDLEQACSRSVACCIFHVLHAVSSVSGILLHLPVKTALSQASWPRVGVLREVREARSEEDVQRRGKPRGNTRDADIDHCPCEDSAKTSLPCCKTIDQCQRDETLRRLPCPAAKLREVRSCVASIRCETEPDTRQQRRG